MMISHHQTSVSIRLKEETNIILCSLRSCAFVILKAFIILTRALTLTIQHISPHGTETIPECINMFRGLINKTSVSIWCLSALTKKKYRIIG